MLMRPSSHKTQRLPRSSRTPPLRLTSANDPAIAPRIEAATKPARAGWAKKPAISPQARIGRTVASRVAADTMMTALLEGGDRRMGFPDHGYADGYCPM